jgi:cold shock protein
MTQGIVKWFNEKKGFGFIESRESGSDIFVHYSEIMDEESQMLREGERVEFVAEEMAKGLQARQVKKLGLTPTAE